MLKMLMKLDPLMTIKGYRSLRRVSVANGEQEKSITPRLQTLYR